MRKLVFRLLGSAVVALAVLATLALFGTGKTWDYRTADALVSTDGVEDRVEDGGSHASITTEWGPFGYCTTHKHRHGYHLPWSIEEDWAVLPLVDTVLLAVAVWVGAGCLLLLSRASGHSRRSSHNAPGAA